MKVLIVDDESENIMILEGILRRKIGIQNIIKAENGKEAVDLCQDNDFDAIFMDIRMPVMNGVEATREIKKIKDVKIVACTAHTIEEIKKSYGEYKFDYHIIKPFLNLEVFESFFSLVIK